MAEYENSLETNLKGDTSGDLETLLVELSKVGSPFYNGFYVTSLYKKENVLFNLSALIHYVYENIEP